MSLSVGGVSHREEYHIALVTLHILQVFYKERFGAIAVHLLYLWQLRHSLGEDILNEVALLFRECHHSNTLLGLLLKSVQHLIGNSLGLGAVGTCLAIVIESLDILPGDVRHPIIGRREGYQTVIVVVYIAECNEALVLRAVVPSQIVSRHRQRDTVVEYALKVVGIGILVIGSIHCEETCRRHLLGVAHDYRSTSTRERSDSLTRRHLTRLVEHHKVELWCIYIEVLRHTQRTHKHHRTETRQQLWHLVYYIAYCSATSFVCNSLAQKSEFGANLGITGIEWYSCRHSCHKLFTRKLLELACERRVTSYKFFEHQPVELLECWVGNDYLQRLFAIESRHISIANSRHRHSCVILFHCLR